MLTMELPLEDVKKMDEEKESPADVAKSENTDVITETTTSEREQGAVPETIRVQGAVPETIRVQGAVPEAIRVQGAVPEAIRVQGAVPEAIRVQGAVPEAIRVQGAVPEAIRVQGAVPEAIRVQGAVPEAIRVQGAVPEAIRVQGAVPEAIRVQGAVPEAIRVQGAVPEAIRVQGAVPEAIRVQGAVPEAIRVQGAVPEAIRVQGAVPEAIQVQEEVPEVIQVQGKVPEAVQEQENSLETIVEPGQAQLPQTAQDQCEAPEARQEKETVLNLNNEVVKMRKEVKRVRALIVRKLTRQIGALKKKKGKDADIERNQRRAARLLEEIHAIKNLVPDLVTKTALQKNLNFDQVCKNPKSTISDRAIARVASHPQFSKRIETIKAAVKAFKDERLNKGKPGGKIQNKADKTTKQPPIQTKPFSNPEKQSAVVVDKPVTANKSKHCEKDIVKACHDGPCHSFPEEKIMPKVHQNTNKKQIPVKNVVKSKPLKKSEEKIDTSTLLAVTPKPDMEAESDLELSESEEKEYFDDSTEERFHKQSSSDSEESDNDFFLGKVNKFKKKKTKTLEVKTVQKTPEASSNKQISKVQSELDELESKLKTKGTSLNSVFCSSLARTKAGKGAGKGDRRFSGQDKWKDSDSGNNQTKFQKQSKRKPEQSDSKYSNSCPKEKTFVKQHDKFGGRGQAKEHFKPKNTRGSMFTHQAPQQPLHPSWEASKKRKEQQGQILAFQGKKIKFDDD